MFRQTPCIQRVQGEAWSTQLWGLPHSSLWLTVWKGMRKETLGWELSCMDKPNCSGNTLHKAH